MIRFDQINILAHFSSLNSAILYKLIEMYGQGRYTITLKNKNKKEMYSLTSTSLSLSHTHFEWYVRISQIEDNIQSYQRATHWKVYLLR